MKVSTLAQAFGSETTFTRWLASQPDQLEYLFNECNFAFPTDLSTAAESLTESSKRVDILVNDGDKTDTVIECMSIEGKLDPVHAAKITYYMHTKGVSKGILLCDYASNESKDYIHNFVNAQTNLSVAVVEMRFIDKQPIFVAVERALDSKQKKQVQENTATSNRLARRQKLFDSVIDLDYVYDYAPSDDCISISSNPVNPKWSPENILIVPQESKTSILIPIGIDPNLFTSIFDSSEVRTITGKNAKSRYAIDLPVEIQNDFRSLVQKVREITA